MLAMDLHSAQIQGYFDIPCDHLYGASELIDYLADQRQYCVTCSVQSPTMNYRLTDEVAEQCRKLIIGLGNLEFECALPEDRTQQLLRKAGGDINYEGLQRRLSEQPHSKRRFDSEILRRQLDPSRRVEKIGVVDKEYLANLVDALNSLRDEFSQKCNGEIDRKLKAQNLDTIKFDEVTSCEPAMQPNSRASRSAPERGPERSSEQDAPELPETIDVTPRPPNSDAQIMKSKSSIPRNPTLDHKMRAKLREDLRKTFSEDDFRMLLQDIGEDPGCLFSLEKPHEMRVYLAVQKLDGQGRIGALVHAAVQTAPDSPYLQNWRAWLNGLDKNGRW